MECIRLRAEKLFQFPVSRFTYQYRKKVVREQQVESEASVCRIIEYERQLLLIRRGQDISSRAFRDGSLTLTLCVPSPTLSVSVALGVRSADRAVLR